MTAQAQHYDGATADADAVAVLIDDFFARQVARAARFGEPYRRLWESIRDATRGGKRHRPALVMLAYRHLAEDDAAADDATTGAAVELASAFELLHTAFVVHDDVIDRDLVRRGRPNVAGRAMIEAIDAGVQPSAAVGRGRAAAILAGDLMISAAHSLVAGLRAPSSRRRALVALLDECIFRTAAGEHADVWASSTPDPASTSLSGVVQNKTAIYSFAAPLQAGAILAGASEQVVTTLGRAGCHLGIAFQLRDDVLGVFGDERSTGKSVIGDLREGKQTLLVDYARRDPRWQHVARDFGRADLDEAAAAELRRVISDSGALALVERRIGLELQRASALLAGSDLPESFTEAVLTITEPVGGRQR